MNYKYSESNFEDLFISRLEDNGDDSYLYECGYDIERSEEEVVLVKDFYDYLDDKYKHLHLKNNEKELILHNLTNTSSPNLYDSINKKLQILREGYSLKVEFTNKEEHIDYIDFNDVTKNRYKVVNQYVVKDSERRIPDIVVFINGIPVVVIELKNPADENADISKAYTQICVRYKRGIKSLMSYAFLCVISDGVNTKVGSLFADYDFYVSWKSDNGKDFLSNLSDDKKNIEEEKEIYGRELLDKTIKGLFNHCTLCNIINNYIYFPDKTDENLMIVPKYSQYYATESLYKNIKEHMRPNGDGKGGTYFGATGCGKSYTMLFLARRLTTDISLNKPTLLFITDRNELDIQLSESFENSKKYLIDENCIRIDKRKGLGENDKSLEKCLKNKKSGGIYLMTIQKFSSDTGLLSDRNNIICISDEAHRTQVSLDERIEMVENEARIHYGFANNLHDAFPNATYVGFTGTPIDETINVFGDVVISYGMSQAVADGATVPIKVLHGPSSVRLDETKLKIVDRYYEEVLKKGTNVYQVEESKNQMASVRTIIDNDERLERIAKHIVENYEKRVSEISADKAMIVCYDRKIAFKMYKILRDSLRPEWFIKKKTSDDSLLGKRELDKLEEIEKVKLVCTRNNAENEEEELYKLAGTDAYRDELAKLFKNPDSNFKIAIVVDMWITGFDCKEIGTMYIDKPCQKHNLIQTISRVNRVAAGKSEGLIVDYIGFDKQLAEATKMYNEHHEIVKDSEVSYAIFIDQLQLIDELFHGFDIDRYYKASPREKYDIIYEGHEFVTKLKETEKVFMGLSQRMKKAYEICVGHEKITKEEIERYNYYMAIRSIIFKLTKRDDVPDTAKMNKEVKMLVDACIHVLGDLDSIEDIKIIDIFSTEYMKKIDNIPYKNTKFKMLLEMLKRTIKEYEKTNKLKAIEFSERMKKIVEMYNNRDVNIKVSREEVVDEFMNSLAEKAKQIFKDLEEDAIEFRKIGITFEEKAFYDILIAIRDKYKFEYADEKIISLAKKVKAVIDDKSKYVDWLAKDDVKNELKSDVIRVLSRNGYPPYTFDDVYDKVLEQVENYKRHEDI